MTLDNPKNKVCIWKPFLAPGHEWSKAECIVHAMVLEYYETLGCYEIEQIDQPFYIPQKITNGNEEVPYIDIMFLDSFFGLFVIEVKNHDNNSIDWKTLKVRYKGKWEPIAKTTKRLSHG